MSLADARLSAAADELTRYGYGLSDCSYIVAPNGHTSGVKLVPKGQRVQARTIGKGSLLWSGPANRVGEFLERFWYAKPLEVTR